MFIIFRLRKAALCLLAVLIVISGAAAKPALKNIQRAPMCLAVVMYHGLCREASGQNRYMISPERFREDLEYLRERGYNTVFISQVIAYYNSGAPLPENPVILTFDDGYLNNYTYAFPLLEEYGMKAVISPIGISADREEKEKYRSPRWSQCKWEELKKMTDSGRVELQNHSYDLHKGIGAAKRPGEKEEDYYVRLKADLKKADERIIAASGKAPEAFVYPFGSKSSCSDETIRRLGYSCTMDCENKLNYLYSAGDLFSLHRFIRTGDISAEDFFENTVFREEYHE